MSEGAAAIPSVAELSATAAASTLEGMTRPLLDWLQRITGLESTYLTSIDWDADEQEILYAVNEGGIEIAEGLRVTMSETLCRRALDGGPWVTDEVPTVYPDCEGARAIGLQTYVSVPVELPGGTVFGTLCGASTARRLPADEVLGIMRFFAQLIADRVSRDRDLQRERAHVVELQTYGDRITALEKVKSDFLRLATHELRQPSTVMSGYVDLLLAGAYGPLDARVRDTLGIISGRLEAMERLFDQMLDIARLEDDRLELCCDPIDMAALLREVVAEASTTLDDRHTVELSLPEQVVVVTGDHERLHLLLGNLLGNAIKYSPAGGAICCTVRTDGGTVHVTVEDEGVGITAAQPEQLFAKFMRLSDAAHAGIPGTGLGLHISREVARRHGGDLVAAPREPRGSTFTLTLPLAGTTA